VKRSIHVKIFIKTKLSYLLRLMPAVIVVIVIALGLHYLAGSHAAGPYVAVEAESGVLGDGAIVVNNNTAASSNGYVQFGSQTSGQDQYPAQILNLSDWKITMPYDSNGELFESGITPGDAVEVTQPALATFTDKYFYVNSTNDAVNFMAPVNGATTSGSGYPRSELRQMATSNGSDEASWNMASSSINSETVEGSADHLPEVKPQIVVAQIHDSSHDIIEILADAIGSHSTDYTASEPTDCSGSGGDINNSGCKFDICYRYDGTEDQSHCLIYDYTIGTKYSLTMSVQNSVITMSATYNGVSTTITKTDTSSDDSEGNYYKAGCYTQSNYSTEGNYVDYGESTIYALSAVYSP
jgi:hypothetical protein